MKKKIKIFLLFIVCLFSFFMFINGMLAREVIDDDDMGGGSSKLVPLGTCMYYPIKKADSKYTPFFCLLSASNKYIAGVALPTESIDDKAGYCNNIGAEYLYDMGNRLEDACKNATMYWSTSQSNSFDYSPYKLIYNESSQKCEVYKRRAVGESSSGKYIYDTKDNDPLYCSANADVRCNPYEATKTSKNDCELTCKTNNGYNCSWKEQKIDVCTYYEYVKIPYAAAIPINTYGACANTYFDEGSCHTNYHYYGEDGSGQCVPSYINTHYDFSKSKDECKNLCKDSSNTYEDCKYSSMFISTIEQNVEENACQTITGENGEDIKKTDQNGVSSDDPNYIPDYVSDGGGGNAAHNTSEDDKPFCEKSKILKAFRVGGYIVDILKILAPVILIIMGILKLSKSVLSSKDDEIKSSVVSLAIKFLLAVSIFFLPIVITAILKLANNYENVSSGFGNCAICLSSSSDCTTIINQFNPEDANIDDKTAKCQGILGQPNDPNNKSSVAYYLNLFMNIIRYVGVALCILLTTLDVFKAITSQDKENIPELVSKNSKRIIYAIILLFLPTVVNVLLMLVGLYGTCGIGV